MISPRGRVFALSLFWVLDTAVLYALIRGRRYELLAGRTVIAAAALGWLLSTVALMRAWGVVKGHWRFLAGAWLATAAVAYATIVGALYFKQDELLFPHVPGRFELCPAVGDEDDGGRDFESVNSGGVRAFVQVRPDARAWVIFFHGNAESACTAIAYARELRELPLNFAVAEYPGYLGDDHANASQVSFEKNAEAVYAYATGRVRLPVISFGRSLGTGVATYLASVRPVAGVVLISPYTSIADVGAYRYPFLPVSWLLRNPFPATEWARGVSAPVLIVHGTADHVVPIALGRELARSFGAHVHMVEYPGEGHGTIVREGSPAWGEIRGFIREQPALRRRTTDF